MLVINGKIAEIGKNLKAPDGTREIDATGQYLMPGIIDAHSHIGIDAVNEATHPVTAEVNVGEAIDPLIFPFIGRWQVVLQFLMPCMARPMPLEDSVKPSSIVMD